MADMVGKKAWVGVYCSCCNDRRPKGAQKRREEAAWRKELRTELSESD
jgi:hypothetical protein